jgi:uncharacterized phage protein gp47/JayE
MPAYLAKNTDDILRNALTKLSKTTPITAIAPGAVARSMAEVFSKELGDMYSILDFNMSMAYISTASGSALDMFGYLFNILRKTLTSVSSADENIGAFNFYLDAPAAQDINIPAGTQVSTDNLSYVGNQYIYSTVSSALIPIGRLRVFVSVRPTFTDSAFTAGVDTLTRHTFVPPPGVTVRCTNAKPIPAVVGYESDDAYRTRLVKAVRTASGGTETAMRFGALSIPGVRDVNIRTAPYGLGSFEVIVTPENYMQAAQLQVSVAMLLNTLRPVGSRMFVKSPQYLPVQVRVTATIRDGIGINKPDITRRVEIAATRYINSLLPGDTLIYNQLIQNMMDSADVVTDVIITSFTVNGSETLRRNVTCDPDQQLVPGTIVAASS